MAAIFLPNIFCFQMATFWEENLERKCVVFCACKPQSFFLSLNFFFFFFNLLPLLSKMLTIFKEESCRAWCLPLTITSRKDAESHVSHWLSSGHIVIPGECKALMDLVLVPSKQHGIYRRKWLFRRILKYCYHMYGYWILFYFPWGEYILVDVLSFPLPSYWNCKAFRRARGQKDSSD